MRSLWYSFGSPLKNSQSQIVEPRILVLFVGYIFESINVFGKNSRRYQLHCSLVGKIQCQYSKIKLKTHNKYFFSSFFYNITRLCQSSRPQIACQLAQKQNLLCTEALNDSQFDEVVQNGTKDYLNGYCQFNYRFSVSHKILCCLCSKDDRP